MTFLPICCFDTIIHSVCVCVSARILLLCKCLVLGLRSTIYVRMYCTWSFQVFGTKGAMSLIYTEICNIVVYPDRHIRSYLHNSQAQLLLMGMHVENTVRKLERCCPCLPWNLQSTRTLSFVHTYIIHSVSWVTTKCTTVQVLSALWGSPLLATPPRTTPDSWDYNIRIVYSHVLYMT